MIRARSEGDPKSAQQTEQHENSSKPHDTGVSAGGESEAIQQTEQQTDSRRNSRRYTEKECKNVKNNIYKNSGSNSQIQKINSKDVFNDKTPLRDRPLERQLTDRSWAD